MNTSTTYKIALGIGVGATLFLVLGIGALGVIGAEGDRADMMFLGVLAIGLCGTVLSRLRAEGMAQTMAAMAAATMIVGIIAITLGKHEAAESSVAEILGLTGMFASLFAASAWRFGVAAQQQRHHQTTIN
jgi:uncharacterized membrane protein YjjB (DUF3815 family)